MLAAAPELGGHDDGAAAETHADELENGIKLVGQRGGGDLRLAEGADHDVVQEVDARRDELLQHHGDQQMDGLPVKFAVFQLG